MANKRINVSKQLELADTVEPTIWVSDAVSKEFQQVSLKSIVDPIKQSGLKDGTLDEIVLTSKDITDDSVTVELTRPEQNSGAFFRVPSLNGKFGIGATTVVTSVQGAATETVIITGFADEAEEGDVLQLFCFWKYADNTPVVPN
jgi:hypothetical protein